MSLVYFVFIHTFYLLMIPAGLFNKKAQLWIKGRRNWYKKLKLLKLKGSPTFWFHASSLGEFEQGLPVMEEMKKQFHSCNIILTFFSPSGYEVRKNYKNADYICYLPLDTSYNAKRFIGHIKPNAAFFIKYEFWYYYLNYLGKKNIPVFLLSGIFRKDQVFFKWYGSWFRNQLKIFEHLFVQDQNSENLLESIKIRSLSISGDTRFDRVLSNASVSKNTDFVSEFVKGSGCLVAGSTWKPDEILLSDYINSSLGKLKFIIAPHEVENTHIKNLQAMIRKNIVLYSKASTVNLSEKQVMIIDNIGMLSSLYKYARFAYIGGGFGKGIHNILEAAVFGIPVIFGPNYSKFREAKEIIDYGGGFSIKTLNELNSILNKLDSSETLYTGTSKKAKEYVMNNAGATDKIISHILKFFNHNYGLNNN